jgi:hypothetical protein
VHNKGAIRTNARATKAQQEQVHNKGVTRTSVRATKAQQE